MAGSGSGPRRGGAGAGGRALASRCAGASWTARRRRRWTCARRQRPG